MRQLKWPQASKQCNISVIMKSCGNPLPKLIGGPNSLLCVLQESAFHRLQVSTFSTSTKGELVTYVCLYLTNPFLLGETAKAVPVPSAEWGMQLPCQLQWYPVLIIGQPTDWCQV